MSAICARCGMLSKGIATNGMCPECNASAQHFISVGERRMAQAIAELKERNRKQDDDIIDMREAIRKRDAEIAALRECIGLLTTLASNVDCGLPIAELGPAIYREVSQEIAALREAVRWLETPGTRLARLSDNAKKAMVRALETTTNKEPL